MNPPTTSSTHIQASHSSKFVRLPSANTSEVREKPSQSMRKSMIHRVIWLCFHSSYSSSNPGKCDASCGV